MKRMAVVSAGFVPVPAVVGGAGEVLTTELINGNEKDGEYYMDIYTIESPKLNAFNYNNAEIIPIHISKWNWFFCKTRNLFLKILKRKYRFIPYNRALLKVFRDNYDVILVENNMQVYEDIYNHAQNGKDNMIFHMHNDIDGTTKPAYLCQFIAKTAKIIIPVSEYIKNHFNSVAPNEKMRVLYNCVNTNVFDVNINYDKKTLRKKYGIEEDDFVFMYTGRICPEKGVLELVKAFKKIALNNPKTKLVIVGSRWYNQIDKDEYFIQLEKYSKDLEDRIVFTGYLFPKDMPEIYVLADSLVIPSMWEEPFGVVALEGMAMKLPIISTNSGGLVEILKKDVTAYIVNRNDSIVDDLAKGMKKILEDKQYCSRILNNAYRELIDSEEYDSNKYFYNFNKIIN